MWPSTSDRPRIIKLGINEWFEANKGRQRRVVPLRGAEIGHHVDTEMTEHWTSITHSTQGIITPPFGWTHLDSS